MLVDPRQADSFQSIQWSPELEAFVWPDNDRRHGRALDGDAVAEARKVSNLAVEQLDWHCEDSYLVERDSSGMWRRVE